MFDLLVAACCGGVRLLEALAKFLVRAQPCLSWLRSYLLP
jgi:hypothetical protein